MCRKLFYLIPFVLVLGSVSSAATIHWTGLGGDNLWSNPANWEGQKVPTVTDDAYIDVPAAEAPNGPVIQDGIDAIIHGLGCEVAGEPTMTMTGGTLQIADWVWWGDGAGCHGTFHMSGGSITTGGDFELGWGGGEGTWIMTAGSVNVRELIIPTGSGRAGQLYLHGGAFNVRQEGLRMTATGLIDITEGTLMLEGDLRTQINGFIGTGQITAYGGAGYFELDYDQKNAGKTTLTAVPITEKAYKPDPRDGAEGVTMPLLQWQAGLGAAFHDLYFGTNPVPGPAEFTGRQPFTVYWHGPGFVPGTTYYWRVDEVETDGTTMHTGNVWSFTAAPVTAYNPDPPNGAKWVATNADLSWTAGVGAVTHDVYFGTDQTAVADGTGGTFKGNQAATTYDPGTLAEDTAYYWRIDEVEANGTTKHTGDIWRFATAGPGGGIKGWYYHWSGSSPPAPPESAFISLVLTRIDPGINFQWGNSSPDPKVNVDNFSARWVGELEVAFSEPYTFITNTDNGVKLWLNEQLIIDNWTDHSATFDTSKPIELTAGQRYLIEMLWYERDGGAVAQLFWQSPSTRRQIIPAGALSPPLRASRPKPANGATNVRETPTLRWSAGDTADKHDVYLGASHAAVESATTTTAGIYRGRQAKDATSYVPTEAPLEWGQTYYWRIDEVAADGVTIHKGNLWGFTVADYLIVDDFEDYDGVVNRIFDVWTDYAVNNTGATVGYFDPPFTERTIVHSGSQSMPYRYDNDGTVNEGTSYEKAGTLVYSEADREWAAPQDWTRKGVKTLTLWFRGKSGNEASQLYVALQDSANKSAVVKHSNPASTTISTWAEWNIPLTDFTGLNLRAIKKLSIGVGDRTNPQRGGSGRLFIDDIQLRLAPPAQ